MTNTEKRKHTRVESLNLSYISIDHAGNVVNEGMGRTLNVSEAGILLESNFCALPDQTISLTLAIEEDLLDVKGKVIRCKELEEDLYHMGVEFLDLDSAARRTLSKFIAMFNDVQKTEISRTDKERSNFMQNVVIETDFPNLQLKNRGKVRDIYDLGDHLLMVASDRLSAFDVVLPDPIPDKGKILTRISLFWFDVMNSLVPNHVVSGDTETYPDICKPYAEVLKDRSMLVKKTEPLPIECVVRGYISGSGWKSYRESGTVCGIPLPEGLRESDKLPEPIFTPSTKAEMGLHDENIDFTEAVRLVGKEIAEKARDLSLAIYKKGVDIAEEKGIIIADTKFEFGLLNGEMILIDEVLTPDSSRFWPKESYRPGGPQQSYDKQYVRDYLKSLDWDKTPPAPTLPSEVIRNTRGKYLEALEQLTGVSHEF